MSRRKTKINPNEKTTPFIRKSPRLNPKIQILPLDPKTPDLLKPCQIFSDLSDEKISKKNENLSFLGKKNYGFLRSGVEKSEICVRRSPRLAAKINVFEKKEKKLSKIGKMEIEKETNKRVTRSSVRENCDENFKKEIFSNKVSEKAIVISNRVTTSSVLKKWGKNLKEKNICEKNLVDENSGAITSVFGKRVTRSSYRKKINLERSVFGAKSEKISKNVGKKVLLESHSGEGSSVFEKRVTRSSIRRNPVERSLFGAKSEESSKNVCEKGLVEFHLGEGNSVTEKRVTRSSSRRNADGKLVLGVERSLFGPKSCNRAIEGSLVVKKIDLGASSSNCGGLSVVNGKLDVKEGGFGKSMKVTGVKRKRNEDGGSDGWTEEQEVALQKAYFAAKPTPNFWKRVAKLVPGKSAHDCFNKVYADDLTPPKPKTRLRTTKKDVSSFSLSPSKVLKPEVSILGKITRRKQKGHLAQKAVRQLLQKHVTVDQGHEADLFSVLEPSFNPSIDSLECGVSYSTPQREKGSNGFLKLCDDKSSSGLKKRFSRLSSSNGKCLVSPPVLKPVKNKVLHEKYIDQLHCREAKRKVACGKENKKKAVNQKMETIDVLKDALVMDAKDLIHKFQHEKDKATREYSDDDDEGLEEYDEDDEV